MAILLNNSGYGNEAWRTELEYQLPSMPVYEFPDIPYKAAISYALVWDHPRGDLATYPNLKAIFSLGAGVEHLATDASIPENIPIVRLVDPTVADDMAMHALFWVINFQRHYHLYARQQQHKHWQRYETSATDRFNVGILGLGNIGQKVAKKIALNGYSVSGWSKSVKNVSGILSFAGSQELGPFLGRLEVLINCLPLTAQTENFIDFNFMACMKPGSFIVNVSRGAVIRLTDLVDALASGHIKAAALDVFTHEPLPESSTLWQHPQLYITPHVSGATYARSATKIIAQNIERLENSENLAHLFNREKGY